ncbi:hypothetical protein [Azorhizobium doebereinerae]|uniref:hypothetical protein n=1 Tax=Azorhizobium doebereinerae TaxID=281091 RepID=UPI00041B8408|nr:hypothetical protein [Azorhizobium doebereinerae]
MSLRRIPRLALAPILPAACLLAAFAALPAGPAAAQAAGTTTANAPSTVRGAIAAVDGAMLTLTTRAGATVKVRLAATPAVTGLVPITMADIPTDAYVGVAAVPQPGAPAGAPETAVSIHVFQPAQRGVGEGTHGYDVAPNSSMTNGALAQKVVEKDGSLLTIAFKGGEKQVRVTPQTSLVRFEPGSASELKPGAQVLMRTTPGADGVPEAARVLVGRDGVVPAL